MVKLVVKILIPIFFTICIFSNAISQETNVPPNVVKKYYPFIFFPELPSVLLLDGKIDYRTSLNFKRSVLEFGKPELLILNSPGGNIYTALDVSLEVDRLGITTRILEDGGCYSACAFIFLAGKKRIAEGNLGVHQMSGGDPNQFYTQLGVADIIDVLNKFDTPKELYVPMFSTPHDDMYILSNKEILDLGLIGDRPDSDIQTQKVSLSENKKSLENKAILFMDDLMKLTTGKGLMKNADIEFLFADEVNYHGKIISKSEILKIKLDFFSNWTDRLYRLDGNKSGAKCSDNQFCNVWGTFKWSAKNSSKNKIASGEGFFNYVLFYDNEKFKIVVEDSKVIKRF